MKESDLCAAFRDAAEADGWIVHPEVGDWDLVLVWAGDAPAPEGAPEVAPGNQVAVEAKLRANVDALAQAIGRNRNLRGQAPDFRAVLVPKATESFKRVARELRIGVYTLRHCGPWTYRRQAYERDRMTIAAPPHRWVTSKPLWVPPIVSDRPAGEPNPLRLTPWRIKALRLMTRLRAGPITSADFRELAINPQIWRDQRWIIRDGYQGRLAQYRLNPGAIGLPDQGFEKERTALENVG